MSLSRRDFVKTLGVGAAGAYAATWVSAKKQDAIAFAAETGLPVDQVIMLHNNENPMGPGKPVLDAIAQTLEGGGKMTGRYPRSFYLDPLKEALAQKWSVKPENIALGAGSTEVLVNTTQLFTSKDLALVGSLPTYNECFGYAELIGSRTKAVPLDDDYRMDLDKMFHACRGAGMLFYCNPNNPAATLVNPADSLEFLPRVLKANKDLHILVDEAYFDYVTTPGHKSMMDMAIQEPRLIVARTFSKAYGMAGLRVGYAVGHKDTIKKLLAVRQENSMATLSYIAALAAIERDAADPDYMVKERQRNDEARKFTLKWFADRGMKGTDCQTNFTFIDLNSPVEPFQAGCAKEGVKVGRAFPPLWTHARISIGTMDEMQRAVKVFEKVLGTAKASAA